MLVVSGSEEDGEELGCLIQKRISFFMNNMLPVCVELAIEPNLAFVNNKYKF